MEKVDGKKEWTFVVGLKARRYGVFILKRFLFFFADLRAKKERRKKTKEESRRGGGRGGQGVWFVAAQTPAALLRSNCFVTLSVRMRRCSILACSDAKASDAAFHSALRMQSAARSGEH